MRYEGFNLQEAFRSQAARVESDWQSHEKQLADEFRVRKQRITGNISISESQNKTLFG
jgi:hypothetical protein